MGAKFFLSQSSGLLQLAILFAILSARAIIFAGGSSLWIRFSDSIRQRKIIPGENSSMLLAQEVLRGFAILLLDASFFVLLLRVGFFHFAEYSQKLFWLGFIALFAWGEIYFYYSHRVLHIPSLFWIHRHHHQSAVINPWTSLAFSFPERLILLMGLAIIPALVSPWIPLPLECFIAYFFANYALNVYGHLNVEILPPDYVNSLLGKILNTTSYHTMHHQRYRGHYGLFTPFLDLMHRTNFSDYEMVHRANYGKAMLNSSELRS